MKSIVTVTQCLLVVTLLSFTGCGKQEDVLIKQQLNEMKKMADLMEKSPEKMQGEEGKAIEKRVKEIVEKLEALNLTQEQKDALEKKYKPQFEEIQKRMMAGVQAEMNKQMESMKKQVGDQMKNMGK